MIRRTPRRWLVCGAIVVGWLAVDRPWTIRPQETAVSTGPFDADRYVEEAWGTRVLPAIESRAVPLASLGDAPAGADVAAALPVSFEGVVVSVDTSSRVGVALVDAAPGDGQPDAALQIGPVLRGTGLRDVLDFVRFSDFTNQIQFAAVARALNDRVLSDVIADVDLDALEGRRVRGAGAATVSAVAGTLPSIVPVRLIVEVSP